MQRRSCSLGPFGSKTAVRLVSLSQIFSLVCQLVDASAAGATATQPQSCIGRFCSKLAGRNSRNRGSGAVPLLAPATSVDPSSPPRSSSSEREFSADSAPRSAAVYTMQPQRLRQERCDPSKFRFTALPEELQLKSLECLQDGITDEDPVRSFRHNPASVTFRKNPGLKALRNLLQDVEGPARNWWSNCPPGGQASEPFPETLVAQSELLQARVRNISAVQQAVRARAEGRDGGYPIGKWFQDQLERIAGLERGSLFSDVAPARKGLLESILVAVETKLGSAVRKAEQIRNGFDDGEAEAGHAEQIFEYEDNDGQGKYEISIRNAMHLPNRGRGFVVSLEILSNEFSDDVMRMLSHWWYDRTSDDWGRNLHWVPLRLAENEAQTLRFPVVSPLVIRRPHVPRPGNPNGDLYFGVKFDQGDETGNGRWGVSIFFVPDRTRDENS